MKLLIPLFSPALGSWGSLTRTMAIAKYFISKGHDAAFCASGHVADTLLQKGYKTFVMPKPTMFGLPPAISKFVEKRSHNIVLPVKEKISFGNIWFVFCITGFYKSSFMDDLVKEQMSVIKRFSPDIIFTEMDPGAYLSSFLTNIPLVTTYSSIALKGKGSWWWKRMRSVMNGVLKKNGANVDMDPEEIAFNANVLKLIPSIPELDTAPEERKDVLYVGNMLEPVIETDKKIRLNKKKKYVFVYMGTGSVPLDTIIKVLPDALGSKDDIECYAASQSIKTEFTVRNINFVNFINAEDILPRCMLTICHGGLNTITQSLGHGVPLLIFPGPIFERRFNAIRVEETGGGFMGELSDFNAEWIKDKIAKLGVFKKSVKRLGRSFKKYHGAVTAYKEMNRILKGR